MGEDSKPKSLTDDIEKLFDLVKEGASYLLHFYLYFISKTFPLEFIENLFDHHKKNSSYDYTKDGKTYIYRLFSCIFEVEKQVVAWGLQYVYSYIPLPFVKNIYENFCVNNNLECTDVKLKKCKKALINSTKDTKKKPDKTKNGNEDADPVSRPFPLFPSTPKPKTETVSVPLSTTTNSRPSLQNTNNKKSLKNSSKIDGTPLPVKSVSFLDDINIHAPIKIPFLASSPPQLNNSIPDPQGSRNLISSEEDTHVQTVNNSPTLLPDPNPSNDIQKSESDITLISPIFEVTASDLIKKPSRIPVKVSRSSGKLSKPNSTDLANDAVTSLPDNSSEKTYEKPKNDSLLSKIASLSSTASQTEQNAVGPKAVTKHLIPPKSFVAAVQDLAKNDSNQNISSTPPSTTFVPKTFPDLAKILKTPATSDDSLLFSDPLAPIKTPSDLKKPNSFLPNPSDMAFKIPVSSSSGSRTEKTTVEPKVITKHLIPPKSSVATVQNLAKNKSNQNDSLTPSSTISGPEPFSELAKIFTTPATAAVTSDNSLLFPNPSAPIKTLSDSKNPSSSLSKTIDTLFKIPVSSSSGSRTEKTTVEPKVITKHLIPPKSSVATVQDLAKNKSNQIDSLTPSSTTSGPEPFSDLMAKTFTTPAAAVVTSDNSLLFPNPSAPIKTLSDSKNLSSSLSNTIDTLFKIPVSSSSGSQTEKNTVEPKVITKHLIPPKSSVATVQDLAKNKSNRNDSLTPTTPNSFPDPFADLAKIFKIPPTANVPSNDSLFPNPFAPITKPPESKKPSSFLSNPSDIFSIPLSTSPSNSSLPISKTVASPFQAPILKASTKSGDSVAPVAKKIPPSIDPGNSFQQTIEQNNKAFEKGLEDIGKSIANVFSGPTPGPSAGI